MTCREATEFLMDYVGGGLPVATRLAFEWHLLKCANCRKYLATYQATVEAGRTAFAPADADGALEVPEELIQAILASLPSAGDA
jgi:anti-sigma factor RsiW